MGRPCIVVQRAIARQDGVIEGELLTYAKYVTLPITIGRVDESKKVVMQVILHSDDGGISRHHGSIVRRTSGLAFVDRSKNGSRVDGKFYHNVEVPINYESIIRIDPYRLCVRDHTGLELVDIRDPAGHNERQPLIEQLETVLGAVGGEGQIITGEFLDFPESDKFVVRWARLNSDRGGWQAEIECAHTERVKLNNKPVAGTTVPLTEWDTLTVADRSFAVVRYGYSPVVCGKPECRLLNPPGYQQKCRFCQTSLSHGAQTMIGEL